MKFNLVCQVTVSAQTVVEAESLDDALKIARDREVVISTGHDGAEVTEQWLVEEADGSPCDISHEP